MSGNCEFRQGERCKSCLAMGLGRWASVMRWFDVYVYIHFMSSSSPFWFLLILFFDTCPWLRNKDEISSDLESWFSYELFGINIHMDFSSFLTD